MNYQKQNEQVELLAITEDMFIYKIPYRNSIKQLALKPWLEESKIPLTDQQNLLRAVTRNKILKVGDSLIIGLHRKTSKLFSVSEAEFDYESYRKELNDSLEYFKLTLRGTGGFQGPVALMHLWALRSILKSNKASAALSELITWEEWAKFVSYNYDHILESINKHLHTSRYDLRNPFYETLDEITTKLANSSGVKDIKLIESVLFRERIDHREFDSVKIGTWNLDNFYHSGIERKLLDDFSRNKYLQQIVQLRKKSKSQLNQIAKNIELTNPDFLLVTEVELKSLEHFRTSELKGKYSFVSQRGNDPLKKEIALLVKETLPVEVEMETNKRAEYVDPITNEKRPLFMRDLPIYKVRLKGEEEVSLVLVGVHLDAIARKEGKVVNSNLRKEQLRYIAKKIVELKQQYSNNVVLLGDFNRNLLRNPEGLQEFMLASNSMNVMKPSKTDYTVIHPKKSAEEIWTYVNHAYQGLNFDKRTELAERMIKESYIDFKASVIDGIFIDPGLGKYVRSSYIHQLVDNQGVVIRTDQGSRRATDHNMTMMELKLNYLKKDSQ